MIFTGQIRKMATQFAKTYTILSLNLSDDLLHLNSLLEKKFR